MRARKGLVVLSVLTLCVVMLSSGLFVRNASAQGWSVDHYFSMNPGCQGCTITLTLAFTNTGSTSQWLTDARVKFEWREATYPPDHIPTDGVAPNGHTSVTVTFSVPNDVPTTIQKWELWVDYEYDPGHTPTETYYGPFYDFSVSGGFPWWIVIVIALVIVVIIVLVVYYQKKPTVQVYQTTQVQQQAREEPVTRVRPAARLGKAGATVASAPATVASAGGLTVSLPGGSIKTVQNEVILGRADFSNVDRADAAKISAQHLRIFKDSSGTYMAEDGYQGRPSTNGTKLNGREIKGAGPQRLRDGDVLRFADIADGTVRISGGAYAAAGSTVAVTQPTKAVGPMISLVSLDGQSVSAGHQTVLGRDDFKSMVAAEKANAISSKHVTVTHEGGQFYIADGYQGTPSTNGTSVNGVDIRGKGKVKLNIGDRVQIASVLDLRVGP